MSKANRAYAAVAIAVLASLVVLVPAAAAAEAKQKQKPPPSCASALPPGAARKLAAEHKGWRILERTNLSAEVRASWDSAHKGECPGVAKARVAPNILAYAALLIRVMKDGKQTRLVMLAQNASGYDLMQVYQEARLDAYPVVYRGAPGPYRDRRYEGTVNIKHDSVIYERPGAGKLAFYYNGRNFSSVQVAD